MSRYGGRFHAHTAGMRRLGTTSIVLLILFAVASPRAQDTKTDYDGEMRNGETYFHKQQYQQALRAYQHAYALTGNRRTTRWSESRSRIAALARSKMSSICARTD